MGKRFDSEENLRKRYENALNSGNYNISSDYSNDTDDEDNVDQLLDDYYNGYQHWKDINGLRSPNDYDYRDGEPPIEASYEEIRASYDRMEENEDDYDED